MNQKTTWTWLIVLFSIVSLMTIIGCGGNSAEDETALVESGDSLSDEFQEVELSKDQVERFIQATKQLHSSAAAEAKKIDEKYEEGGVMGKIGAIHRFGKFSDKMIAILKDEGFTPESYNQVSATVYTIVPLLLQEKMTQEIEKDQNLEKIAESTIAAFEEMLKNPHLSAEDKEEIKKQIEEQKANHENMQSELEKGRQELEKLNPENVKILREYLEKIVNMHEPTN